MIPDIHPPDVGDRIHDGDLEIVPVFPEQALSFYNDFIRQQVIAIGKIKRAGQIVTASPPFLPAVYFIAVDGQNFCPDNRIVLCRDPQCFFKFSQLRRLNVEKEDIRGVFRVGPDKVFIQVLLD